VVQASRIGLDIRRNFVLKVYAGVIGSFIFFAQTVIAIPLRMCSLSGRKPCINEYELAPDEGLHILSGIAIS
jgi:hypothetical protein